MHGFELPKFGYTTQTPAEATVKCSIRVLKERGLVSRV